MRTKTPLHHQPKARWIVFAMVAALTSACAVEDIEDIESEDELELRLAMPADGQGELEGELEDESPPLPPEKVEDQCEVPQGVLAANCAAGEPYPTCYNGMNGSEGVCDVYECRGTTLYRCEGIPVTEQETKRNEIPKRSCLPTQQGGECQVIPI